MAIDQTVSFHLTNFVDSTDYAVYVCITSPEGAVLAEAAETASPPKKIGEVRTVIHRFLCEYPHKDVNKMILDDDSFTIVVQQLNRTNSLMVLTRKDAPLGVVTMNVAKLASQLE